jgi:hypothetical protein
MMSLQHFLSPEIYLHIYSQYSCIHLQTFIKQFLPSGLQNIQYFVDEKVEIILNDHNFDNTNFRNIETAEEYIHNDINTDIDEDSLKYIIQEEIIRVRMEDAGLKYYLLGLLGMFTFREDFKIYAMEVNKMLYGIEDSVEHLPRKLLKRNFINFIKALCNDGLYNYSLKKKFIEKIKYNL